MNGHHTTGVVVLCSVMACAGGSSGTNAPDPSYEGPQLHLPITRRDVPAPGLCRVFVERGASLTRWNDLGCNNIELSAPLGSYIMFRSREDREEVYLCYMSTSDPGVIDGIEVYNYARLRLKRVVLQRAFRTAEETMKCIEAEGR